MSVSFIISQVYTLISEEGDGGDGVLKGYYLAETAQHATKMSKVQHDNIYCDYFVTDICAIQNRINLRMGVFQDRGRI